MNIKSRTNTKEKKPLSHFNPEFENNIKETNIYQNKFENNNKESNMLSRMNPQLDSGIKTKQNSIDTKIKKRNSLAIQKRNSVFNAKSKSKYIN